MNIALFFGGNSTEHDVSVLTALFVSDALKNDSVYPVRIGRDGIWRTGAFRKIGDLEGMTECLLFPDGRLCKKRGRRLKPLAKIDCAVNCCHGGSGENGDLAGYLALCGVPVTSSDPFSARVAMNKGLTKRCLPEGVRVAKWVLLRIGEADKAERAAALGFPLVVKPASGGSSIGVSVCRTGGELAPALELAFTLDDEVLVEEYISDFKEVNCAAYRSPAGEILCSELESPGRSADILSFQEKYLNFSKQSGDREFPAVLSETVKNEILQTTRRVYDFLGMAGIVRMDYLVAGETVYFNEINSVPGSLAFYLFERDFSEVLTEVLKGTVAAFRARETLVKSFSSNLLAESVSAGAKRGGKTRGKVL